MTFNPPLLALAIGAFGIGVTEFAPMGLLPVIATDLGVSIPTAGLLVSAYAMGVLIGAPLMNRARKELEAFLCSCLFLIGMLTSVTFGVYPYVLPSNSDPALSLSIYNAAAPAYGLGVGLMWFIPGMLLTAGYFVHVYRSFAGKVKAEDEGY